MIRTRTLIAGLGVAALTAVGFASVASADGSTTPAPTKKVGAAGEAHLYAFYAHTTSDQRICLADQGLTAPSGKLTAEQRAEVIKAARAAAEACDVKLPKKANPPARFLVGFARLTSEQQACVAKAEVTRPIGRLTDAQRATLKADVDAAVAACGVK